MTEAQQPAPVHESPTTLRVIQGGMSEQPASLPQLVAEECEILCERLTQRAAEFPVIEAVLVAGLVAQLRELLDSVLSLPL